MNPAALTGLFVALLVPTETFAQKFLLAARGSTNGDAFGSLVAAAGDVDRDGKPDFLVSAPATFGTGTAAIHIISGRDGTRIRSLKGAEFAQVTAIDGGHDADKDGHPDFLAGFPQAAANGSRSGKVVVYSGKTGKPIVTVPGTAANRTLGQRAVFVGDLDRDGGADFLTDQTGGSQSPWHQVLACSGRTGKVLWSISGIGTKTAVGAARDLDKDGYPEVVIRRVAGGTLDYFQVCSGKDGTPRWTSQTGHMARTACWVGDLSRDGIPDLIVLFYQGLVAYSGKDGKVLFQMGGNLGGTIAATGDVDRDGVADFALALPQHVRVISGRTQSWIYRIPIRGVWPPTVHDIGDLDGDGCPDFAIGRPWESSPTLDRGAVYVFSPKGFDLTWKTFGRACSSSATPPRLTARGFARIGAVFDLDVDRLIGPTLGGLWISASNTSWAGGSLPFDLSALGMTGCSLLVAPHILVPFASTGTSVRLRLTVPFDYSFVGAPVFLQGYAGDKAANPLGVATSGGLRGAIWL